VTLSDDDPDLFALYINLAYTGLATRGVDEWSKLIRLYGLAEKLQDIRSQNDIIDAMHAFIHDIGDFAKSSISSDSSPLINARSIVELYERTSAGSPVRRLVLDSYAEVGKLDWMKAGRSTLPIDFIFDLATNMISRRPIGLFRSVYQQSSSHYHVIASNKLGPTSVSMAATVTESAGKVLPSTATVKIASSAVAIVA